MASKAFKTVLFGSLIAAMILLFGDAAFTQADAKPPLQQVRDGVPLNAIACSDGRVLMASPSGSPACVFASSAETLDARGFVPLDAAPPPEQPDMSMSETQTDRDAAASIAVAILDGEPSAIPSKVSSANNAFAIDMYRQLHDGNNAFFSPLSIYMAVSMLYEATSPSAAEQLHGTFGFDPDLQARYEDTARTLSSLNREDPHAELSMANALWLVTGDPKHEYVETVRNVYRADVSPVNDVEQINKWASNNTNGKIKKVLEDLGSDTIMILTNAIYFKGTWVVQFDPDDTRPGDFYTGNGAVTADMMSVYGGFEYAGTGSEQVLRMPYEGDRLSMLVALPRERDRIDALEERLSANLLEEWGDALRHTNVEVKFPKFETRTHYSLNESLKNLGTTEIFGVGSLPDISPLAFVSSVLHDGYVKVNEEGTEVAAVTTIVVNTESVPPPPPRFVADHPFLFFIQDNESGAILFMGKIVNPTK